MTIQELVLQEKIIVIVRKTYGDDLLHLCEALNKGGIRLMEVTFDQADPACEEKTGEAIAMLNRNFRGDMHFGAGTVLSCQQVDACKANGGEFIISPSVDTDVIRYTKAQGLVSIPGAMTPTEILTAHKAGADFVKLFPAARLGAAYINDILGPISHVKMIVTAGITEENFGQFLAQGMVGAGISGRLTDKKLIASGGWEEFTARAQAFVKIARENS